MATQSSLPLITVGIPTYNRPEGLANTLKNVTTQTYSHLEILISDNASSDEDAYRKVVDQYSHDTRIKYFRQKTNLGSIGNFPFLVEKATGDYFLWISDDDDVQPNYIEELQTAVGGRKDLAIVFGGYDIEDIMSEPKIRLNLTKHHAKLSFPTSYERMKAYIQQPDHLGKSRLNWGMFPLPLIQRAFDDCKRHLSPEHIPSWADYPIDFRLLSYGDLKVVDKVLWHVKLLPTSEGQSQLVGAFSKMIRFSNQTALALEATISDSDLTESQKSELANLVRQKSRNEKAQLFFYYQIIGRWPWAARKVKQLYYALFS